MFRKMRRFKQQVSEEECIRILHNAKRGVLALQGDDGYPYAIPMDFVYDGGKIYFHSAMEGHKIDAIKRCDKASFCVLNNGTRNEGEWWYQFVSVVAFGRIRMIEDRDTAVEKLRLLGLKYFPTKEEVEEDLKRNASRAESIEFVIEHMTGKRVIEN